MQFVFREYYFGSNFPQQVSEQAELTSIEAMLCSRHSFTRQAISPGWTTITYSRLCCMVYMPLAITTEEHQKSGSRTLQQDPLTGYGKSPLYSLGL